jgi:hypothetical protein
MRKKTGLSEEETHLAAFFEAYFSNHIEGTEFEKEWILGGTLLNSGVSGRQYC